MQLLRAFGMTKLFGNPGSTELPLFRDFPADFQYVLGLQEGTVVGMADGYAQASRNAAFVNLHSAAGVGHAMGNLFTAYRNRTPLVITAGQQARSILPYEPFLFSSQATELPRPYVKWSCEPARAEDVPAAIARAYYLAMQPPCGPTFVSIPVDDWDRLTTPVAHTARDRTDRRRLQHVLQPGAVVGRRSRTAGCVRDRQQRPLRGARSLRGRVRHRTHDRHGARRHRLRVAREGHGRIGATRRVRERTRADAARGTRVAASGADRRRARATDPRSAHRPAARPVATKKRLSRSIQTDR
jgi:hypothetical protein